MLPIFVAFLTLLAVTGIGGAALVVWQVRDERESARLRALHRQSRKRRSHLDQPLLLQAAARLGEAATSGSFSRELRTKLSCAGFHAGSAPAVFLGAKLLLLLLSLAGLAALLIPLAIPSAAKGALAVTVTALLYFLPDVVVGARRRARSREIRSRLPDSIDLLEICVSAGMGLDTAWNAVAKEIRGVTPVLADEMELTNLEISLGVERSVAMRHMSERTDAEDISSLVALLIQSERFGSSILDALRTFATSIRHVHSTRAEESAEKVAVKLLFPMVMFIFPALLIVLAGPAMILLVQEMG